MKKSKVLEEGKIYKDLVAPLFLEQLVAMGDVDIEVLKNLKKDEIVKIIEPYVNECIANPDFMRCSIIYVDTLTKQAELLKEKEYYNIALALYAISIEHLLNDIISKALVLTEIKDNEITNIMRLDIESKRTWLFPLLNLPRLSENTSNYIKKIFDKRNEFVHYKWKPKTHDEIEQETKEYKNLCEKSKIVIKNLKKYITQNLVSRNKIKKQIKNIF